MNEIIREWLALTEGLTRMRATETGSIPVSEDEVRAIAEGVDWAELDDMSDLIPHTPNLFRWGLIIGNGNLNLYCHSSGEVGNVEFFTAYE